MDAYDPATVFSSIDSRGRYAYQNQPGIAHWNLARLAECLLPLLSDSDEEAVALANQSLARFGDQFQAAYLAGMRRKLGLHGEAEGDAALAQDLLDRMAANKADFTLTFRRLGDAAADFAKDAAVQSLFDDPASYDDWALRWRDRLKGEPRGDANRLTIMRRANPAFVPRNYLVEAIIEAAVVERDFAPFEALVAVLASPFEDRAEFATYADVPPPREVPYQTFCGT